MKLIKRYKYLAAIGFCIVYASCKLPVPIQVPTLKSAPAAYNTSTDTTNSADMKWQEFFNDPNLIALIDTAINNNPEMLMILQDIEMAKNKIQYRHGALLPMVSVGGGIGIEKVGLYTSQGAGDASADITEGHKVPEHLPDFTGGIRASWEIDIWGKLKNAKNAAMAKYLASFEGRNFVRTNLIAEIANSYYELLALDNQLDIIRASIELQKSQLEIVKIQKQAAVVTELAVKQFEAQLLNSQSLEYEISQSITETENKINYLMGRFPQPIVRDKATFNTQLPNRIKEGIPSQLLRNRPDIRQAELELVASKFELKAAQLEFYPSLAVSGRMGLQAFRPDYWLRLPESILYTLASDMAGPIINKNAITAEFRTANAIQIQTMYEYQKRLLNAYVEVNNELSHINNLEKRYSFKSKEADVQTLSISIANDLFKSARANYLEVLTTQREALETKLELVEIKKRQFNTVINVYRALGGGWK
jgi:outer membrane protein, multidrug efflux system